MNSGVQKSLSRACLIIWGIRLYNLKTKCPTHQPANTTTVTMPRKGSIMRQYRTQIPINMATSAARNRVQQPILMTMQVWAAAPKSNFMWGPHGS